MDFGRSGRSLSRCKEGFPPPSALKTILSTTAKEVWVLALQPRKAGASACCAPSPAYLDRSLHFVSFALKAWIVSVLALQPRQSPGFPVAAAGAGLVLYFPLPARAPDRALSSILFALFLGQGARLGASDNRPVIKSGLKVTRLAIKSASPAPFKLPSAP